MTLPAPNTPSTPPRAVLRRRLAAVMLAAVMLAAVMLAAACSSTDETVPAATPPATTAPAAAASPTTEAPPTTTTSDTLPDTAPATTVATAAPSDEDVAEDSAETVEERRVREELAAAWPEPAEPAEPSYDRRSDPGLLGDDAYFDHAAIRALFPACPPPHRETWRYLTGVPSEVVAETFGYWDRAYANWDAAITEYGGDPVPTGWWTDEQLAMVYTGGLITAANAGDYLGYKFASDTWGIWYDGVVTPETIDSDPPPGAGGPYKWADGTYNFKSLYLRAAAAGYVADETQPDVENRLWSFVFDTGVPTDGQPNPQEVDDADLLAEWTMTMYPEPPTKRGEPAAWAMRSLLDARDADCVAPAMRAVCSFGGTTDELAAIIGEQAAETLSGEHRFGALMRNLVCPQNT